jgi:excisionase family DNA binding protein
MMRVDGIDVLDVQEAARYVHRTPETVRRWVWSGRITARRQGNRLLVARADLDRIVSPRAEPALDLAGWAALLPTPAGSGSTTAADLVLDDRAGR